MLKKLFIISADDDSDDQDLIEEALKDTKHHQLMERVSDGLQLLHLLDRIKSVGEKYPDIIFLDLNMPIKSGKDTLQVLKAEQSPFKDIPVVVLTTSSAPDDMNFCYKYGANFYLVKPNSFKEFANVLNDALNRHAPGYTIN